jgi:hypothetical protein
LVVSLLFWGAAVFAFDLVALGLLVTFQSPAAQKEIDIACDPMHVNSVAADVHAAFEAPTDAQSEAARKRAPSRMSWLWINPVDLFRAMNIGQHLKAPVPWWIAPLCGAAWIGASLWFGAWKLRRIDL